MITSSFFIFPGNFTHSSSPLILAMTTSLCYLFIPPYVAQVVTSVVDVPEEVCDLNLLTFIPLYVAQVVTSVVDVPEEVCDLNPLTFIPYYVA